MMVETNIAYLSKCSKKETSGEKKKKPLKTKNECSILNLLFVLSRFSHFGLLQNLKL